MTVPHLMNCPHNPDGWCLDCVAKLHESNLEQIALRDAVSCKIVAWSIVDDTEGRIFTARKDTAIEWKRQGYVVTEFSTR